LVNVAVSTLGLVVVSFFFLLVIFRFLCEYGGAFDEGPFRWPAMLLPPRLAGQSDIPLSICQQIRVLFSCVLRRLKESFFLFFGFHFFSFGCFSLPGFLVSL